MTQPGEALRLFADNIAAGESPNDAAGLEWADLAADISDCGAKLDGKCGACRLGQAWARAEAALPAHSGGIELHGRADLDYTAKVRLGRVYGSAGFRGKYVGATASTPDAALAALAEQLEALP